MSIKDRLKFITEYGYKPTIVKENTIVDRPPLPWWYNDVAKCLRSIYDASSTKQILAIFI